MHNRSASYQTKTGWSMIANFLANCSPSRLLVTYLALYSQISSLSLANAQTSIEVDSEVTYLRAFNKEYKTDMSECVKTAASCVLTAEPYGNSLNYEVRQTCGDAAQAVRDLSIDAQLALDQFVGSQFCNGVVSTNKRVEGGSVEDSTDLSRTDSKLVVRHRFFKSQDAKKLECHLTRNNVSMTGSVYQPDNQNVYSCKPVIDKTEHCQMYNHEFPVMNSFQHGREYLACKPK